ncbi:protein kinase [Lipomyces tetrasporus]|uniref:Protein kinase n=1 Tax=Lipomyces tetrasporus TaxID=54092 RepID=A0AAD7VTC2_9ASCO|nr:protein kinase [Lipomyces tetrasporus]KAJ8100841.1 protein kinase [Lipomyces tetrasporus]
MTILLTERATRQISPKLFSGKKEVRVRVSDDFTIGGPNGFHTCLVSLFAGPDIAQICYSPGRRAGSRRLRGSLARKFAKQVTLVVGYLHSAGVAHGDLNTLNVLIQLAHADLWSDQDVYELLGFPVTDEVRLWSGELNNMVSAPEYLVEPANLSSLESKCFTKKILLVDFGQSFTHRLHRTKWYKPLGKLPEPWWSSWEKHDVYFDEGGKPKNYRPNNTRMLTEHPLIEQLKDIGSADNESITDETNIVSTNNVRTEPVRDSILEHPGVRLTEEEVEVFEDLLRKMLRYNPEQRLTPSEILKDAWFTMSFADSAAISGSNGLAK